MEGAGVSAKENPAHFGNSWPQHQLGPAILGTWARLNAHSSCSGEALSLHLKLFFSPHFSSHSHCICLYVFCCSRQ